MKIECHHCGASGQLDPNKIPPGATSVRCPRCQELIPLPAIDAAPPPVSETAAAEPLPQPRLQETAPTPTTPPPVSPAPAPHAANEKSADCAVCNGHFPEDDMVRFGASWVCAACKPYYVRLLAQGTALPGQMRYAGFGVRFGAKFLDGIILALVSFLVSFLLQLVVPKSSPPMILVASSLSFLLQVGIAAGYSGYFLSRNQATPGKMACGLMVVSPSGAPISAARGIGRYFGELVSSATLGIGYLMVFFDAERRALHDRICGTRVIYK